MRGWSVSLILWTACSGGSGAGDTDSPESADTGTSGDTDQALTDGPIGDCGGRSVTFAEATASEVVQWKVEDQEFLALPGFAGAYFFSGYLHVATYAADFSGGMSFGLTATQEDVAAGTYTCASGEAMVQVSGVGMLAPPVLDADCSITFDQGFGDGGRIEGTMWAMFPPNEPLGLSGGCVHARFTVTDAVGG